MSSQLPNGLWADFQPGEDARLKANANFNQLDWTQWKCIIAQLANAGLLPVTPAVGDAYLVGAQDVYIWYNLQWNILTPPCGWMFYDQTLNEFFWNVGGITTNFQVFFAGIYNFIVGPGTSIIGNIPIFNNLTGNGVDDSLVNIDPTTKDMTGINKFTNSEDVVVGQDLIVTRNVIIQPGAGPHSVTPEFANEVWEKTDRPSGATVGKRGIAISAESGLVSETTTTPQDIGVVAELETTGRSVEIFLTSDSSIGQVRVSINDGTTTHYPLRDGTIIFEGEFAFVYPVTGDLMVYGWPVSCVKAIDNSPPAGVHQYTCRIRLGTNSGTGTITVDDTKIVAHEL